MSRYDIERMEAAQAKYCRELSLSRFKYFKSQDVDQGLFDVAFEVKGKIIRAHKIFLASVSEPLKAMMSPPWAAEGETIKIEKCSYDAFYEFLCYLYSCRCKISKANVVELTDLAESYAVPAFKDYCDTYLSKMENDIQEFYEMVGFAEKYSLPKFKEHLEWLFFYENIKKLTADTKFMDLEQQVIMVLSTYKTTYAKRKELFFTSVYKWAEHQALKNLGVDEFNLNEAIKMQLTDVIPLLDLSDLDYDFVLESIMPKEFLFSFNSLLSILVQCVWSKDGENKAESYAETVIQLIESHHSSQTESESADFYASLKIFFNPYLFKQLSFDLVMKLIVAKNDLFPNAKYYKFLSKCKRRPNQEEKLFETVYQLAETNVLEKQKLSPETNFDLLIATKEELYYSLEDFKFCNMSQKFIENFIVAKRILSEDESREIRIIEVKIENHTISYDDNYLTLTGRLTDNYGLFFDIKSKCCRDAVNGKKLYFPGLKKYDIPETRSTVKKLKGCEWYLCFEKDGTLALKHQSLCKRDDYLLAEMEGDEEFTLSENYSYCIFVKRPYFDE